MVALGPGTPTAQQRSTLAQVTAPSWPTEAGGRLSLHQGGALRLAQHGGGPGRDGLGGTGRRSQRHRGEKADQTANTWPNTPVYGHGAWGHGAMTIAVGAAFSSTWFATLAWWTGWTS